MLELHALSFMTATTELTRMKAVVGASSLAPETQLVPETIEHVKPMLEAFGVEAMNVGAKLSWISADKLFRTLSEEPCRLTWGGLGVALSDIESRFADHLHFVKLFVIPEERAALFNGADELLKPETANLYPSVWFDCEESAKCLCLGRPTASVFHSMRMIEVAISAISRRLSIPDPSKSDRSWGTMLNAIKAKINEIHPMKGRTVGCEGSRLEGVYVSLDAMKNPWRNATMHVENTYTEDEARHIIVCASHLFDKMAAIFDENGHDVPSATLAFG